MNVCDRSLLHAQIPYLFPNCVWIKIVGFPPTPDQKGINSNTLLEHPAAPTKFSEKRKISMGTFIALNFICSPLLQATKITNASDGASLPLES